MQVVDLGGVSTFALVKHQRSPENQAEWQHNADFNPETMVRVPWNATSRVLTYVCVPLPL